MSHVTEELLFKPSMKPKLEKRFGVAFMVSNQPEYQVSNSCKEIRCN